MMMIACFFDACKQTLRSKALIIAVKNGSSGPSDSFNRNVAIDSSTQHFVGNATVMRRTSSLKQSRNSVIDELTVRNDDGGEQLAVSE